MKDGDSTQPATDARSSKQTITSSSFLAIQLANIPNLPQAFPVEGELPVDELQEEVAGDAPTMPESSEQSSTQLSFRSIQLVHIPDSSQVPAADESPQWTEELSDSMPVASEAADQSDTPTEPETVGQNSTLADFHLANVPELPQSQQEVETASRSMPTVPETPQPAAEMVPETPQSTALVDSFTIIVDTPQPPLTTPQEIGAKWRRVLARRNLLVGGATAAFVLTIGGLTLDMFLHPGRVGGPGPSRLPTGPKTLIPGVPLFSLTGHTESVQCAAWSPTGLYLATAGKDGRVTLWDIASYLQQVQGPLQVINKPRHSWKFSHQLVNNAICWSADGSAIAAVVTGDHQVHLLDAFSNTTLSHNYQDVTATDAGQQPTYAAVSWSPNAAIFATVALFDRVAIDLWQTFTTTRPVRRLTVPDNATIVETAWSADGALLAGLTNLGTVITWETATGKVQQVITGATTTAAQRGRLAWSPIDPRLLAITHHHTITLWDTRHNRLVLTLQTEDLPARNLVGLTWSPNGTYIAGCYEQSHRIYIWDARLTEGQASGNERTQLFFFPASQATRSGDVLTDVQWSPDGRYIVGTLSDATATVWKVDQG